MSETDHLNGSIKNIDQHPDDFHEEHEETIKILDDHIANIAVETDTGQPCGCTESSFKILCGLLLVLFIAVTWTAATQLAYSAYSDTFHAPYFQTWLATSFMLLTYPLLMFSLLFKKSPFRLRRFLKDSTLIFGEQGFCVQRLLKYVWVYSIPFCVLWLLTNYCYLRGLLTVSAGTTTAVFSSSVCFVYLFSLVLLKSRIYVTRILSILLCVGGIVLLCYAEGFHRPDTLGIVYVVGAAIGSALYQVMFKYLLGSPSGAQVSLFLTLVGAVNTLLMWPVIIVLHVCQVEVINWQAIPWGYLCGAAGLGMLFNFLVNFGIAFTFPLFISLGTLVGVPLSELVDALFRHGTFGAYRIGSFALIIVGFALMLVPHDKLDKVERCARNDVQAVD